MSNALDVEAKSFEKEVLKSEIPTLVDFWAPWCGPCQMMGPILDEIAEELKGKVKIVKLNTEEPENQQLAMEYQIMSIPNMKLFKDGKVIKEFVGSRPKEALKEELEKAIK
jgi:thioredoxin 1